MHIFINKNFLTPIIKNYFTLEDALNKLQNETILRSNEYNVNVYVINNNSNEIYNSDGNVIYLNYLNSNKQPIIFYKYIDTNFMGFNYKIKYKQIEKNISIDNINKQENTINNENKCIDNMNITFNNKKNNYIFENKINLETENKINLETENKSNINNKQDKIIVENNIIKENKKEELLKLIEQFNELYQKELSNIKKLDLIIKSYDTKIIKLEKNKKDEIINNIIRTQSEYQTWKKLKYIIKEENDVLKPTNELELSDKTVPVLFLAKYNYLEKIQTNETIKKLLEDLNKINLNELYSEDKLIDEQITKFSNKYMKLSKELHYKFDHEWDYLENELNVNSTNKLV